MKTKPQMLTEPRRRVPVRGNYEVVVVGGGPAGVAAAVAAARGGARTLLVERYGYLGGLMTGGWVNAVLGMGDGARQVIRGFAQEMHDRLRDLDVTAVRALNSSGDYQGDIELFKYLCLCLIEAAGGHLLLHTLACDAIKVGRRVRGLLIEGKSGREALSAEVVIDASADGDIAFRAGAPYTLSRYDISPMVRLAGVDRVQTEAFQRDQPARYAELVAEAKKLGGGVLPGEMRYLKGFDATATDDLTRIENDSRRELFAALLFLKKNLPGWVNARVADTAPQLGVRESRRIRGGHVLSEKDMLASRRFPDAVCTSGAHMVGYETYGTRGLEYDLPYRCLVPEEIEGLLCAGRCISTTHGALNTMRLIAQCMATGQAAGAAAALAVKHRVLPRRVPTPELQATLLTQGVYLQGAGPR